MTRRIPAEAFHPWTYIKDELDARGWTLEALAMKMPAPTPDQIAVNLLTMELTAASYCFDEPQRIRIGPATNARIAAAFGQSAAFWDNIEASYQASYDLHGPHEIDPEYVWDSGEDEE